MTWVIVVAMLAAVAVWVRGAVEGSGSAHTLQRAALESEAAGHYYNQALAMARILDRIERDEMMAVTIPTALRADIREVVESFFGEGGRHAQRR